MKISLRQLEVFLSVARSSSVSKSAEELLISQSAVSMSLGELERILGGALFDRPGKRLHLNDRGHLLLPRAMEICDRVEEIEARLQGKQNTLNGKNKKAISGRLRIAASSTVGNYLIPRIMGAFVVEYPDVQMGLEVKNSAEVIQSISHFEADAGFVEGIVHNPDMIVSNWQKDHMVIIASPNHPLANKKAIEIHDLKSALWIMREVGSGTREVLENALHNINIKAVPLLELGNTEAVKCAVESSIAIACLSRITVATDIKEKRFVEIHTPFLNLERNFYYVVHREKYLSALLLAFLEFADQNLGGKIGKKII